MQFQGALHLQFSLGIQKGGCSFSPNYVDLLYIEAKEGPEARLMDLEVVSMATVW